MQNALGKQRGMTIITVLLIIAIAGIFLTVAFKLGPHYMQFMTVKSVMDDVKNDPESKGQSGKWLLSSINKRLYINEVRSLSVKKDFKFMKASEGNEISVDYEVRQPLFGNLEALMIFDYTIQIDR